MTGAARARLALEARFSIAVGPKRAPFRVEAELALERGVLVLFGRSGSGKSLTVKALAGLVTPESGHLVVAGERLFDSAAGLDVPAHQRRVGFVPQHQALFPFIDVEENILFGLPRAERKRNNPRIERLMRSLEIAELARARPQELSGGERQRVALARALAVKPNLLLLDEPFAAIDAEGKRELRALLRATVEELATPTVLVTHDPADALDVGDVLVRFERGRTAKSGPPREMLESLGLL
ncbi:MAG: ATP-binding cassette domain-containing protein [Polyangiaceae bacterium]